MKFVIYKTTNLINGKIYVGYDTSNNPAYLGSGTILNAAIKKYGRDNFSKEILEFCNDHDHMCEREIYWIDKLEARNNEIGYNILLGGDGGFTSEMCKQINEKLGKEGRCARARKSIQTLGKEGCVARAIKANETLGVEGRLARWKKSRAVIEHNLGKEGISERSKKAAKSKLADAIIRHPELIEKLAAIDRTSEGWVWKATEILEMTPQGTLKWMKKFCPEIYFSSYFSPRVMGRPSMINARLKFLEGLNQK